MGTNSTVDGHEAAFIRVEASEDALEGSFMHPKPGDDRDRPSFVRATFDAMRDESGEGDEILRIEPIQLDVERLKPREVLKNPSVDRDNRSVDPHRPTRPLMFLGAPCNPFARGPRNTPSARDDVLHGSEQMGIAGSLRDVSRASTVLVSLCPST